MPYLLTLLQLSLSHSLSTLHTHYSLLDANPLPSDPSFAVVLLQLPTFGAAMEDVQGFAVRGWDGMHSPIPTPRLRTKVSDFQADVLPSLQSNDTVVILLAADTFAADSAAKLAEMAVLIKAVPSVALVCVSLERPAETQFVCSVPLAVARDEATTAAVSASAAQIKDCADVTACIQLPAVDLISGCGFTAELASKLCLNVISTGQ